MCRGAGASTERHFPRRVQSIFSRENLLRWLLALGCFGLVIFFFSPCWGAFSLWARVPEMGGMIEVRRGVSVLAQVAHPGAPVPDSLHAAIQWRLLFPLIGYALNLPTPLFFALADFGCVVVLAYLISVLRRHNLGWTQTALSAVTFGAAAWFFVSTGWLGYFDSWLAFALLLVAFGRSPWTAWAACVWAPWIDERFVMAAPLAFFCRWIAATNDASEAKPAAWKRAFGVAAGLLAGFLLVRLGLLSGTSAARATLAGYFSGKNYLDAPIGRIALGIWEGLRGAWLLVLAAVLVQRRRPAVAAALGIAVVATIAVGLATSQDYSRSMSMLLPVAVLGALEFRHFVRQAWLAGATAAALLLPAHHVMNDRVNPIYYLYHELAALRSPPAAAMPELRELHAIHAMAQGDFAQAEADLTLAIKLAENPASAAKQRGVLYATTHRWEEAKRDFTTVVENDPDSPDGWFLRSQVELALGDKAAARADFDHARSVAPEDWIKRPDVSRFLPVFTQQVGKP